MQLFFKLLSITPNLPSKKKKKAQDLRRIKQSSSKSLCTTWIPMGLQSER
jgi:hypothetical protein